MRPLNSSSENNQVNNEGNSISLLMLLAVLVKIGSIGFGGGIATIALMEEDFVKRRRLLPLQEFVHGIGLGHMLGGFAVNVAAFIGYRLFGITGALLSAVAFVAPSFLLILVLSHLYFRFHAIPALQGIMAGLSPVVIALILNAAWSIGNRVLHSWSGVALGATALIAGISRVNAALVLVAAGAAGFVLPFRETSQNDSERIQKAASVNRIQLLSVAPPVTTSIATVFITFLKVGSVFFGGGFVLIPILHTRLVTHLGWLTPREFLDGLAISNLTPGPVALIVAFAGFHLAGVFGAVAATIGIFAPGLMLTIAITHEYNRIVRGHHVQRFLAGINPAVAGLIVSAALTLGAKSLVSWQGYLVLALSLAMLIGLRWSPVVVLAFGAAVGYLRLLP